MIEAFIGPMWAGKTSMLVKGILPGQKILAIDHQENKRNSDRELFAVLRRQGLVFNPILIPDGGIDYLWEEYDFILVDEAHFVDVFGGKLRLIHLLCDLHRRTPQTRIRISGVVFDCFQSYCVFPVWGDLKVLFPEIQVYMLSSFMPCSRCGETRDIFYSAPKKSDQARCGDQYESRCTRCLLK